MNVEPYSSGERRPIASRERKSAQIVAGWLAARGISPNSISVAGMVCGIVAGACFACTGLWPDFQRAAWLLGAILVQLRLLANMFDGMVAIATKRASPLGELFNEVPDRVSDASILIGVGYSHGGSVAFGFGAACAALFTAYVRAMGKVAGAQQEFCGPMAKPQRMFLVTLLGVYNGLTPTSWQPVWNSSQGHLGIAALVLALIIAGGLLTAWRRLRRTAASLKQFSA